MARNNIEERRVELLHSVQYATGGDESGVGQVGFRYAPQAQRSMVDLAYRFDAAAQIAPEGFRIRRAWQAAGNGDDGDIIV